MAKYPNTVTWWCQSRGGKTKCKCRVVQVKRPGNDYCEVLVTTGLWGHRHPTAWRKTSAASTWERKMSIKWTVHRSLNRWASPPNFAERYFKQITIYRSPDTSACNACWRESDCVITGQEWPKESWNMFAPAKSVYTKSVQHERPPRKSLSDSWNRSRRWPHLNKSGWTL